MKKIGNLRQYCWRQML